MRKIATARFRVREGEIMGKNVQALLALMFLLSVLLLSCAAAPRAEPSGIGRSEYWESPDGDRMIVVSVSLDLFVRNTEEETRALLIQHAGNLGGFISNATATSIVARIPSARMDEFLDYARTLGSAENERRTGTDITDQFRNDAIRLDSLQNVRARYLALLDLANTISEMLAIERELERVVLEIERLEARLRQAETNVAYTTITVRVRERTRPGPVGWVFYGLFRGVRWLFVW